MLSLKYLPVCLWCYCPWCYHKNCNTTDS